MTSRSRISLIFCVLAVTSAPKPAAAQLAPTGGHYDGRSSDTGREGQINSSGDYQTSVPLDLPPARGGLPLPLSIVSSGRRMGAAGLGWDVPLSYILRENTFTHRRPAGAPGSGGSNTPPQPREQIILVFDG